VVPIDKDMPAEDMAAFCGQRNARGCSMSPPLSQKSLRFAVRCPAGHLACLGHPRNRRRNRLEEIAARGRKAVSGGDTSYDDMPIDPDRLATIVFTSGTTAKGRGSCLLSATSR
jgi:long-chain acyl-CoA synthetase